jgi:hypothetical protein
MKNNYINVILGSLEKLTILFIILKLIGVLKLSWMQTLIPLWAALIFGGLIGLYWFIKELPGLFRSNK